MKKIEKIFCKDYPCGSRMKITFVKIGGPIIAENIEESAEYKKEIETDEKLFYLKKLDDHILNLLKQRRFEECTKLYIS